MHGGEERLGPVFDPLQGHVELLRQRRRHVLLAVDVDLGPEPAADFGRDGAHPVLAEARHPRREGAQDVRVLGRRPEGQLVLARLVVRHHPARFDGVRGQPLVDHALRDDHVGVGERLVDGRVVDRLPAPHAGPPRQRTEGHVGRVVGVQHGRPPGHRQLGVDHRGQRLDVDGHRVGGVARRVAVARHDHRHRVADEAHRVHGHRAMLGRGERGPDGHGVEEFGDLRPREDRLDAVHRGGGAGVDRPDAPVRDVAALEREVAQAVDLHVVDIGAAPPHEPRVFAPFDALADQLGQHRTVVHGVHLSNPPRSSARGRLARSSFDIISSKAAHFRPRHRAP